MLCDPVHHTSPFPACAAPVLQLLSPPHSLLTLCCCCCLRWQTLPFQSVMHRALPTTTALLAVLTSCSQAPINLFTDSLLRNIDGGLESAAVVLGRVDYCLPDRGSLVSSRCILSKLLSWLLRQAAGCSSQLGRVQLYFLRANVCCLLLRVVRCASQPICSLLTSAMKIARWRNLACVLRHPTSHCSALTLLLLSYCCC